MGEKVSISTWVDKDGGVNDFDEAELEALEELAEIVMDANDERMSRSKMIRQSMILYHGVLEAFAQEGELESVPTGIELKHWSRQMAESELRRLEEMRED